MDGPIRQSQDFSAMDCDDPSWPLMVVPFSVEQLTAGNIEVAKHFDTMFVMYAGSFEGCGCGFNASYAPEWFDAPEVNARFQAGNESRRQLREYVEKHHIRQIYACWSGDEALDPESHLEITPQHITDPNFQIPERVLLRISER